MDTAIYKPVARLIGTLNAEPGIQGLLLLKAVRPIGRCKLLSRGIGHTLNLLAKLRGR